MRYLRRLPTLLAALCLLAVPASAGAAPSSPLHARAAATPAPLPTISKVTPLKLPVGEKLTIFGRHYIPGAKRNTVVFLRDGAPAVFLKAGAATRTRLVVTITSKLGRYLIGRNNGEKGPTRFRIRILARRFGARFTPRRLSPTILPPATPQPGAGTPPPAAPVCSLESAMAAPDADADGDGLANGREVQIKTDPCNADTDGDAITDGYEVEAALDLNSRALPYPGKRPYPNALDPSDRDVDYDGDSLTLAEEFAAWVAYGGKTFPLSYSDGTQTTGGPVQVTPATLWQDLNGDGFLTDDEKDVDADGLTNFDETHGRMIPEWWAASYKDEKPYVISYLRTDWLDPDTDGDTLVDSLDDIDFDGYSNVQEIERLPVDGLWVNPFNPCLPDPNSRTCTLHPPIEPTYPPFGAPGMTDGEAIPLVWPRP